MNYTTNAELADMLSIAADVLERGGVIAGQLSGPGGHCALGAIIAVEGSLYSTRTTMLVNAVATVLQLPSVRDRYNPFMPGFDGMMGRLDARVAAWSNNLVDAGHPEEVIAGFRLVAAALATTPDDIAASVSEATRISFPFWRIVPPVALAAPVAATSIASGVPLPELVPA